jgi:hypothetical protein
MLQQINNWISLIRDGNNVVEIDNANPLNNIYSEIATLTKTF